MIYKDNAPSGPENSICIHGAREHNLKNLSVEIPRNKFVVVTGVSGSGKSTLAFDILFAEGQRRFLDSMNVYARQDHLVPPESSAALGNHIDSRQYQEAVFEGGHIGLMISEKAQQTSLPEIGRWLAGPS